MSYYQKNLFLSLCGTSILTHDADAGFRKLINRYANYSDVSTIPDQDRKRLEHGFEELMHAMKEVDVEHAAEYSAELNSIIRFYNKRLNQAGGDYHLLICTDTWLGKRSAEIVKEWLTEQGLNVEVYKHSDLQTQDLQAFQLSLSDLVKYISNQCENYKNAGYRIIFNLTAGFKSVQGFMQTLAMIYADESIYIFESGEDLMRIPRLPIRIMAQDEIRDNLSIFRRLSMKLEVNTDKLHDISEVFLIELDGDFGFSAWGEIIWDQNKRTIYSEKIWPPISPKLTFGPHFTKSLQGIPGNRIFEINKKVDLLCRVLEKGMKYNVKGLDFKQLSGDPVPGSTHELDAWHDQDAKRLYGHYEADTFVLDKLDKALH